MKTVGQIVREQREQRGLTLGGLAKATGATRSYLSMIENHRVDNPPSQRILQALERALRIDDGRLMAAAQWQNTPAPIRARFEQVAASAERGKALAAMLRDAASKREGGDGLDLDALYQSGRLGQLLGDDADSEPHDPTDPPPTSPRGGAALLPRADIEAGNRAIPLINRVAAGYPADFTDLGYPARVADDYLSVPGLADPDAFAACVCGESMQPEYAEGDLVVFSPAATITDGCDCFVRLEPDHEATFKRVFFDVEPASQTDPQAASDADSAAPADPDLIVTPSSPSGVAALDAIGATPTPDGGKLPDGPFHIRLQPLNPKFPARSYPREQVAGLYRAVWKVSRL